MDRLYNYRGLILLVIYSRVWTQLYSDTSNYVECVSGTLWDKFFTRGKSPQFPKGGLLSKAYFFV